MAFSAALRSHHAILYAGPGSASSARSDEQPSLGVHPKRVQRERGPVQLHTPAPAHLARTFTASPAGPTTCRAPPSKAAELGAAVAEKPADRSQPRGLVTTQTTAGIRSALARLTGSCRRSVRTRRELRLSPRKRRTPIRVSTSGTRCHGTLASDPVSNPE